ncbi:MAG: hypothetical protein QOJ29_1568 [Thermoleophilaceae bacterium]|jgi:hypothetical protein|nr:hypothetical protein [Thermoleophilaceae bacterium]
MASEQSTPHVPRRMPLGTVEAMLRWLDHQGRTTPRLLLFGLVVSVLGTFELSRVHPAPWVMQGGRVDGLHRTLEALNRGWPILTSAAPGKSEIYAAGATDDQGVYLIVPWLAHLLGWQDPVNLFRWMALVAFAIPIALYPWLIRELSGSTIAGLASPFVLLIGLWLLPLSDIYWVTSWIILAMLPVLLLMDRRWPRHGLTLLFALLVLASLASTIRSQAGLPVLLGALLLMLRRPWPRVSRAGAIALCVVAYFSVSAFGMAAVRAERDHQLHGRALVGATGTGHPFWHTAYIGLGYLPNDWDIRYYDLVGYRDVLRVDPKAMYLGPAYNRILRHRYFQLIGAEPGFAAKLYVEKLVVALRWGAPALLLLALAGPWLLLLDERRRRWRRDALFVLPAAIIGLLAPLLATPDAGGYLLGWLAAILLAAILAGAAVVGPWRGPQAPAGTVRSTARAIRARPAIAGMMVAGVIVLLLCAALAPGIRDTALRWASSAPPPQVSQPADATH